MKNILSFRFVLLCLGAFVFSSRALPQTYYLTTGFEKTDPAKSLSCDFENLTPGTFYNLDSTSTISGRYSLYVSHIHADSSGETFQISLPKSLLSGLRAFKILVKIRENGRTWPTAGLWCKARKDGKMMGWASTMKGQVPYPLSNAFATSRQSTPLIPWMWSDYTLEFIVNSDPDEVIIGGFVLYSAWFDDLRIFINGNEVNNMVIPMMTEKNKK